MADNLLYHQNAKYLKIGWDSMHISDSFNCYSAS